jgi:cyclopropane-fatty-acyl-phospholipid synthase
LDPQIQSFDRIVTVEMLEAVGHEFLPVFFKQVDALLKPRGVISLQVITIPDARYKNYLTKVDFIQKHIFPGGHCPSVAALTDAIYTGSAGRLIIDEVVNIGPHYAKALRLWREKFVAQFDQVVAKTGLYNVYTPEFKRKWEFCRFPLKNFTTVS